MYDPKADPFLEHRKRQEAEHHARTSDVDDPMASLVTVEFNTTELCNRTCEFCPRVDPAVYPNRNLNMTEELVSKVARDLAEVGYKGRVSFSGFGEPLLNKKFASFVEICRRQLPENTIETNTNGDFLNPEIVRGLFTAGLTHLYVNLYDGPEQRPEFEAMMSTAGVPKDSYKLRDHWVGATQDFGLNLNNRSGMVDLKGVENYRRPEELSGKPCYYPFYKMLVDWDGKVLFCSNDWGRQIVVGDLTNQHVREVWLCDAMTAVRRRLGGGDRGTSPCNSCNVEGVLHGRSSFELLNSWMDRKAS